jgi:hypothetical protein
LRSRRSGTGSSSLAEPRVEVLERLREAHLGGVELAHRGGKAILGEVARLGAACLGDELHRAHRWTVVAVGEHVDVRVGHAAAVECARRLGEASVGEAARGHQGA